MLERLLEKLNKSLRKTNENQAKEIKYLRKQLKDKQTELIEDFIMTINGIHDTHAMHISEDDKQKVRNSIIDYKIKQYTEKLIELSNISKTNSKRKEYKR